MTLMDQNDSAMPVFGDRKVGKNYIPRPGAYALILNKRMELAVLRVKGEYFLPGGGIDPGELPEEALQREAAEECGWSLAIGSLVGEAVDYIEVQENGHCYEIQSRFYRAELLEKQGGPVEPGHEQLWLPLNEVVKKMRRQSQAWAAGLLLM